MTLKDSAQRVRALVEGLTGTRIFRDLPGGIDLGHDIQRYLPALDVRVVFDVGANVGQSTSSYVRWFEQARIYAFEPAAKPYSIVAGRFRDHPRVEVHQLAMSSAIGSGTLYLQGRNDAMSSLQREAVIGERPSQAVALSTIAAFCIERSIQTINFLKIDTEGHDLDVLRGAEPMLARQNIDLIQVEAGMNKGNHTHVPFEAFKGHLEGFGYALFRMYEQVSERAAHEPHLRRTNLVFCSERVIANNRRDPRS